MKVLSKVFLFIAVLLISFYLWILIVHPASTGDNFYDFGDNIPDEYPVMGIDVSHYQGDIDWQQVRDMKIGKDSISFVFIKATEGISLKDDQKRNNAIGARSVEIDYGFYHFFIPSISATDQADFFCKAIAGYNFDLKPVLDVELENSMTKQGIKDSVKVFLDSVEGQLNVRPIIYTNTNYYKEKLQDLNELFWIAQYAKKCDLMHLDEVICWQFSERGTVDGIEAEVDLNVAKESFFRKMAR